MHHALLILALASTVGQSPRVAETLPASEDRRAAVRRAQEQLANDPAAGAVIEKALVDPDPTIRLEAVNVISGWVQPGSFSVGPESCLTDAPRWEPPRIATLADAASSRLHDPDPRVRAAAVHLLDGRELMPQRMRSACIGGPRRAMHVERQAYLSNTTVQTLKALATDSDKEVRSAVRWTLLMGAPVDDAFVDLLFDTEKDRDQEVRLSWGIGMQRIGVDAERSVTVVERLATAPVATRREGCAAISSWEAEPRLLDSLQAWGAQESDGAAKACLAEVLSRQRQQLAYTRANAPALARVRALESLLDTVTDVADAVPQLREALRDPDLMVRQAALGLVVDWTIGQLDFGVDTPDSFSGLGVPAMRTLTLDDFAAEIAALMNDPEPALQSVALELFAKADLIRQLGRRLEDAYTAGSMELPTLSMAVVRRLSSVPGTADPHVRQVAARMLLRYAPVDDAHVARVIDRLTSADPEVANEAAGSILRLGSDQSLLTMFIAAMRRLPASARRQAVHGVAGLMLEEGSFARLEAWARDEGESAVGRDLRALLDELQRER